MTAAAPGDPKLVSLLWAGPEHAGEIAVLHKELFEPAWDEPAIRALLDHPAATALVAMFGNPKMPVGFVLGQLTADEAEILSIGVAKAWQRKGLGRRLVEGLARAATRAEAKSLHLEVADDNTPALVLYHHLGFKEAGRRKDYYTRSGGDHADALRLALKL
jgi:ribosomal-protein-alanine N-acetyltransferase